MYDLTENINEETLVFPGDPKFQYERVQSLEKGSVFNLYNLKIGNHTGTHIDYPAHVIKNGKTSSDYPIESLIGSGLIIEMPAEVKSITEEEIKQNASHIQKGDFVFFKTANSNLHKKGEFIKEFVYLELSAAKMLIEKGVKIVGIDYLSVDAYAAEDLPVHKELLRNNVLVVENLKLDHIPAGRYEIYIMPIKIEHMDGLPARVIAMLSN